MSLSEAVISSWPSRIDLAGDLDRLAVVQAHDRAAGHALAGAGLTHDRQGLALVDRERHVVDGREEAVLGGERDAEVADLEERGGHVSLTRGSMAA